MGALPISAQNGLSPSRQHETGRVLLTQQCLTRAVFARISLTKILCIWQSNVYDCASSLPNGEHMKQSAIAKRLLAVAVCGSIAAVSLPTQASNLAAFVTVPNTDFAWSGYGGIRGNGTGSVSVTGVTGTVTYAVLIWQGPTNDAANDAANAAVTFNGTAVTGTNIGNSSDNCWGFANSRAYQANVTSLVTGNGSYSLSNFLKAGPPVADINGVSLLVFYNDGNAANNRDYAIFLGNDSNQSNSYDAAGWNATLNGVTYASGNAAMRLIVADGQISPDNGFAINASTVLPAGSNWEGVGGGLNGVFNGGTELDTSGGLWDHSVNDITSLLSVGNNDLALTDVGGSNDCLSLIGVIFDLPAGSAPPGPPPPPVATGPVAIPTLTEWGVMLLALLTSGIAALNLRRRRK